MECQGDAKIVGSIQEEDQDGKAVHSEEETQEKSEISSQNMGC